MGVSSKEVLVQCPGDSGHGPYGSRSDKALGECRTDLYRFKLGKHEIRCQKRVRISSEEVLVQCPGDSGYGPDQIKL